MRIATTAILQFALRTFSAVLGILALVYFGNVLGSEKIGTYSLGVTVVVWLSLVADPGIRAALVKRISEGEDRNEFFTAGALTVSFLVGILVSLVLLFEEYINAYVGMDVSLVLVLFLIAKMVFLLATADIIGRNKVATASLVRFVERVLRPTLQLVAVLMGMSVAGLLYGYVASLVIGCVLGLMFLSAVPALPSRDHFERLFSFAKFSVMGMLGSRAARWTDTAVLGFFVSNNVVGVYEIAWSVALALILATDSLVSALFPKMSELSSDDKVGRVTWMTESGLVFTGIVVIPAFVGSLLVGEDVLGLFGREFSEGIVVLPILATWSVVTSYQKVLRSTMDAMDRPDLTFKANTLYVVVNLAGNVSLVYFFGWVGAAVATTGASVLMLLLSIVYADRLLDISYPVREIGKQVVAAGSMALVVYPVHLATRGLPNEYVLVPVGVGAITYALVLLSISELVQKQMYDKLPDSVYT